MPTIDDLNAAFAQLERGAPTEIVDVLGATTSNVEIVHALARTNHRPRRALTAIGGAVAVAATVAAIVTVSSIGHGSHSPAASGESISAASAPASSVASQPVAVTPPALLASTNFALRSLPAGLAAYTDYTTRLFQQISLSRADDSDAADLYFSDASDWHPTIPADAVQVSINGVTGYYSPTFDLSKGPSQANLAAGTAAALAWQPTSGYWAFATQLGSFTGGHTQLSQQDLVATASAVYSDGPKSARTAPVKIGYLPTGLVLFDTTVIHRSATDVDVRFDLGLPSGDSRGSLTIEVETSSARSGNDISVNGFSGSYDPALVRVGNGQVEISLSGAAAAPISMGEATQILQSVTVAANVKSTAGWFPLATALP